MQVTVRTERSLVEIDNVFNWFYDNSQLVVMSRSKDGKETIRQCWRNWVYFDVVTREDEKPAETVTESEVSKESEDGKELLKLADHSLKLAQANSGEKRRHNVTVALTDLEEWAKLAGVDMNEVQFNLVIDPERRLIEARQAIQLELDDSFIPTAIAHLRAVLEHMKGEKSEEQEQEQGEGNLGISELVRYMAGDFAVPGTKTAQYAVVDKVVSFEID